MFRLTRHLALLNCKRLNPVRLASSVPKNDGVDNEVKTDFQMDNKIEFDNELTTKQAYKDELIELKNDLENLSLAECLRKYEYSIEDALKLDPTEQKRIIIKVSTRGSNCLILNLLFFVVTFLNRVW